MNFLEGVLSAILKPVFLQLPHLHDLALVNGQLNLSKLHIPDHGLDGFDPVAGFRIAIVRGLIVFILIIHDIAALSLRLGSFFLWVDQEIIERLSVRVTSSMKRSVVHAPLPFVFSNPHALPSRWQVLRDMRPSMQWTNGSCRGIGAFWADEIFPSADRFFSSTESKQVRTTMDWILYCGSKRVGQQIR
jgi:hypothetical protein